MPIAIGDIHGCLEPLTRLVQRLPPHEALIFLGDYVDRGPHSDGVLHFLRRLARQRLCRFLKGNHEELMLQAVRSPHHASLWLANGGDATLRAYGEDPRAWSMGEDRAAFLRRDQGFLEALELYVEDEETVFVHAGLDPGLSTMADQRPEVLLWIREAFFRRAIGWQGKEIIFGHTPTRSMGLPPGDIFHRAGLFGIDTGCVYGGVLTALDSRSHRIWQEPGAFFP